MFSWKRLKHRSSGKLHDLVSQADSSVDFSSHRSVEMSTSDTAVSKPVEAAEIMALARYYDKLCSSKASQTTTTTKGNIPTGFDTSNYTHVVSSCSSSTSTTTTTENPSTAAGNNNNNMNDEPKHIPVFRIAQRRTKGLEDVCLPMTPLHEKYYELSEADTSAMLQGIDELVATALQVMLTSASLEITRPPFVVNSNYEPVLECTTAANTSSSNNNNNNNNSSIDGGELSLDAQNSLPGIVAPPSLSSPSIISTPPTTATTTTTTNVAPSSSNVVGVRSILLRPNANSSSTKPKELRRVQFTLSALGNEEVDESKEKSSDSGSVVESYTAGVKTSTLASENDSNTNSSSSYNNTEEVEEEEEEGDVEEDGDHLPKGSSNGCISSPFQSPSTACSSLFPKDIEDIPSTELSDDGYSDEEEDSTIGQSSTVSIFSVDPHPVGFFCSSISTATRGPKSTACGSLGFQSSPCTWFPDEDISSASKEVEKSSLFNRHMLEDRRRKHLAKNTNESNVEDRNDVHNRHAYHTEEYTSTAAGNHPTNNTTMTVYYSMDGGERLEEIGQRTTEYSLSAEEEDDENDGTVDGYTTEDTATTTSGYNNNNAETEDSSEQTGTTQEDDDDETSKNTTDESRDDSEFTWQASFPSKEFVEEMDDITASGATLMEYSDSSNDVAVSADKVVLGVLSPKTTPTNSSRGYAEHGKGAAVANSSAARAKTDLRVQVDNNNSQPPTTPRATKTTPTKDYNWGILSPKKLLSFSSPSSKAKHNSLTNNIHGEWNDASDNSSQRKTYHQTSSTMMSSHRKVRSPSPAPKYLLKTVISSPSSSRRGSNE